MIDGHAGSETYRNAHLDLHTEWMTMANTLRRLHRRCKRCDTDAKVTGLKLHDTLGDYADAERKDVEG